MQEFFKNLGQQAFEYGPRILWAVVLLVVFYVLSWIVGVIIRRVGKKVNVHQVVVDLIVQCVGTTLFIVGCVCVLGTLGVDVTAIIAGLGLAGFALGFALKDVLSNVLSGVFVLYYRPFWIEDKIKVSGHEGAVTDIDLRYTSLQTENSVVLLPNSVLFTNSIEILEKKAATEPTKTLSAKEAETHSQTSSSTA